MRKEEYIMIIPTTSPRNISINQRKSQNKITVVEVNNCWNKYMGTYKIKQYLQENRSSYAF